jgi:hypothetical protein
MWSMAEMMSFVISNLRDEAYHWFECEFSDLGYGQEAAATVYNVFKAAFRQRYLVEEATSKFRWLDTLKQRKYETGEMYLTRATGRWRATSMTATKRSSGQPSRHARPRRGFSAGSTTLMTSSGSHTSPTMRSIAINQAETYLTNSQREDAEVPVAAGRDGRGSGKVRGHGGDRRAANAGGNGSIMKKSRWNSHSYLSINCL